MTQFSYLGTKNNLTGIPSLLISSLQQVQDPVVQTALYQIQNWANSFSALPSVLRLTGTNNSLVGPDLNPTSDTAVQLAFVAATTDTNGIVSVTFATPFTTSLGGVWLQNLGAGSTANQELLVDSLTPATLTSFGARFIVNAAPFVSQPVNFMYLAIGV